MGPNRGIWIWLFLSVQHKVTSLEMNVCWVNTELRCNFACDCTDCSDEKQCGYEAPGFVCSFEEAAVCGWTDKSDRSVYSWERCQRGSSLPDSGPSSDFTTGTQTGWFMAVRSVSQQFAAAAMLVSPLMNQSSPTCQLHIRYFIWDAGAKGLDALSLWGSVRREDGQSATVWRPESTSLRGWREASVFLGHIPGGFRIQLNSRRSQGLPGDIAVDQLAFLGCALPGPGEACTGERQICDGTLDCWDGADEKDCGGYQRCDFEEENLCGWDLRTLSSLKFRRTNQYAIAGTNKPKAGPGRDHTSNTESGHFLYLTMPDNVEEFKSDWSSFQSPVLEPTNSTHPCRMVFYTHQFGPRSGGLSVLVVSREIYPVWERGGELGDLWVKAEVEFVMNTTFQILLVGAIRNKDYGGIAIDDIILSPECRISNESSPVVMYPPPPEKPCTDINKLCDFNPDCEGSKDESQCGDFSYEQGSAGWTDCSVGAQGWQLKQLKNSTKQEEYLCVVAAPGQQQSDARTRTPLLGPSGLACALRFSYKLTGISPRVGKLSVSVIDKVLGTQALLWEFSGRTGDWVEGNIHIGVRDHRFQVELAAHAENLGPSAEIAVRDVHYVNCHSRFISASDNGLSCNFEEGLCDWYQDQMDNFDWIPLTGMDHTYGLGTSLVVDLWSPSLRGLSGRLLSLPHRSTTTEHCLSFWYKLYGPQTGTLNVKVRSMEGSETLLWTRSGAHGNRWHEGLCQIPNQLVYFQLVFEALRSGFDGQVAIDDVAVWNGPCATPSVCSFESQRCGFTSSGASRWIHQNWASGGVRTSPKTDHTLETEMGHYMVADTSVRVLPLGSVASLTSQTRNGVSRTECVQFWYYMGGDRPGTLSVYVQPLEGDRTKVFSDSLSQGEAWRHGNGNISTTGPWQLVFEVKGAEATDAHVAIDDITFLSHSCPAPDEKCNLEKGLCGWSNTQNPTRDLLDWELSSVAMETEYPTPPHDHSLVTERGHFLFLPSSPRDTVGYNAWLLSAPLPPTLGTCLRFWVYKAGSRDGELRVWRLSGTRREELLSLGRTSWMWTRQEVDITSPEEYQIVLEGVKGTSGALALDDIEYTVGVSCVGENRDKQTWSPPDSKAGIVAAVVVLLLLLIVAVLLVVYLWKKNSQAPPQAPSPPTAEESFCNVIYDFTDGISTAEIEVA